MNISWVAIERMVEQHADLAAKTGLGLEGRAYRVVARAHSDDELLVRLRSLDLEVDRPSLEPLCRRALSAQELTQTLGAGKPPLGDREEDWLWVCLAVLWERWFPDEPCFEILDDRIQAGYRLHAAKDPLGTSLVWLDAWADVLTLMEKGGIRSMDEFDERFAGSQSLFNWSQDLEDHLWNAGLDERHFLWARVEVCREGLRRFSTGDPRLTENRRRALAESLFELGQTEQADALYKEWLEADPGWGWGWMGWSDLYRWARDHRKDHSRGEEILNQALSNENLRDRTHVVERLAHLDGKATRPLVVGPGTIKRVVDLPASPISRVREARVGRNEPCPCGSGQKYKRCCGR